MKLKEFHNRCFNRGPTLVVIKVKGTGQIVGGFNPESWGSFVNVREDSFIFSLGGKKKS